MKHLQKSIIVALASLSFSMSVLAEDPAGKGMKMHHGGSSMQGMNMGMCMKGMEGMSEEEKEKKLRKMQEHMLKMHEMVDKILAEKDPKKKEQLKEEHIQMMKDHMAKMRMKHKAMMKKREEAKQKEATEKK